MARIRLIEIRNFRCLKEFKWTPAAGLNCFIGPGDAGKSSVIDAIDYCLGARRNLTFSDADFYALDVTQPISIAITLGELDDGLKSMETYGNYLRSFDSATGKVEDEPENGKETALTLCLTVKGDLEPVWTLLSERAEAKGQPRYLTWSDRLRLCPTRIGAFAERDLAWRRGSVLTKLSDEKAESSGALAEAARQARTAFGDLAGKQLATTLGIVSATAKNLGIQIGKEAKALLDAHSVSFSGGTISLHNEDGVPLQGLGTGSTRLLVAGLQRRAAKEATVILIDEVEHGLEPHRIRLLLHSIGSKETPAPLQGFLTTHSPVVVRELSAEQLTLLRRSGAEHKAIQLSSQGEIQGTARAFPEAFLASSVIVCEGASEVGLLRGLDQVRAGQGKTSMTAAGVELVDAGGIDKVYRRANAFRALGYRVTVLRDDDVKPSKLVEGLFVKVAGPIHTWRDGRMLEDELFASVPDYTVTELLDHAVAIHGEELVSEHITSASNGKVTLAACKSKVTPDTRAVLANACSSKKIPWFKSVSGMEYVAREIVGPVLAKSDAGFNAIVDGVFTWIENGRP
jgi:AAA domain, putative AbiEii toxin, Type IV TA system/AAA domain/Overcoming lysogenization defect protein-like, TOPRIM domain